MESNNSAGSAPVEMIVKLKEYVPLESAYVVLKNVFRQRVPRAYVVDFDGVEKLESAMLGVLVLMKRHALDTGVNFEMRNNRREDMRLKSEKYLSLIK
ncbi:MAG: STAS domain-containing protein [Gammaproteobacteria bacterium]|nr:STAS domain-containing protein [Gammaproteobacteria bacterium]